VPAYYTKSKWKNSSKDYNDSDKVIHKTKKEARQVLALSKKIRPLKN